MALPSMRIEACYTQQDAGFRLSVVFEGTRIVPLPLHFHDFSIAVDEVYM